ncbi:MAG: cytochrome c [Gemmatimonadaceae bacterium]|nr:cytochrome c [Gemmatimonadaceae bacterium]
MPRPDLSARPRRTATTAVTLAALALLTACGGGEPKPADTAVAVAAAPATDAAAPTDKGAATYTQICASCHQATGLGVEGTFPPLAGSAWLTGDAQVPIAIVIAGLQGEISVGGKAYNGAMQAWGMLSNDDVANVLTYTRSQWGNAAGPVTPAEVKAVRDKIGSRSAWTAEELKKEFPGAGG